MDGLSINDVFGILFLLIFLFIAITFGVSVFSDWDR